MTKILYPGSFDPITKGHMNIIEQASNLFDEVIIAVLQNPTKKNGLFTLEERFEIIKELYKNIDNIKVVTGNGASVDIALLYQCKAIIRGLRSLSDYDYEVGLQQINKDIIKYVKDHGKVIKKIKPSKEELDNNNRSRSAILRIIEKI